MPEWALRRGQPGDVAVIVEFNQAMAWETERRMLDAGRLSRGVAAVLEDPSKGQYWIAESGGEVMGQLMVTLEWSDWRNGWFWWLQSVYVKPGWRRRGVFRSLAEAVEASARERPDVCGLRLYMEPHNDMARTTYLRLGWTPAGYELLEKDFTHAPQAAMPVPQSSRREEDSPRSTSK